MGTRDKVKKGDLMDFICEVTKVDKADIGQIDLQRSFSFFEVDKSVEKKVQNSFKGVVLDDGRELRVNRDN